MASDEITISQTANCAATLVTKEKVPEILAKPFVFDKDKKSLEIGGWGAFYSNMDDSCPIQSCVLKNGPKCDRDYQGSDVFISALKPWTVNAKTDNPDGYNETLCMQCSNSGGQE